MPDWPCLVKTRGLPKTAAVGLMKASLRSLVKLSGRLWPLGIEEIHLAGAAFHEHVDHALGLAGEVGLLWC